MSLFEEIKELFLNDNVTNFAIASVFSQTFYPVVNSLVKGMIIPLIYAVFYEFNSESLSFSLRGNMIKYGDFISNFIIFILSMLTLFFVFIKPFQKVKDVTTAEDNIIIPKGNDHLYSRL